MRKLLATSSILLFGLIEAGTATAAPPLAHTQIHGPFVTVQDVTAACLVCHPKQGEDILHSSHWTWKRQRLVDGEQQTFSKKNGLTTFAIAAGANPSQCLTCHISTNLLDERFDPTAPVNIDCLVCHDATGMYMRTTNGVAKEQNLEFIAQQVDKPRPQNCLICHGTGPELAGQKIHNGIERDVHLIGQGGSLTCQNCHPSEGQHRFQRELVSQPGAQQAKGCAVCHTETPHKQRQLNEHAEIINCETCHIPTYGTDNPALVGWNWISQGPLTLYQKGGSTPAPLFMDNGTIQAHNMQPVYLWDDGSDSIYTRGKKTQKNGVTMLQTPSKRSAASKIAPFTVMQGTQLIDAKYRYLVSPELPADGTLQLSPAQIEEAATKGMQQLRLPFSGAVHFTTTMTYRRLSHGVTSTANTLGCMDCHGKQATMNWQALGYAMDPWGDKEAAAVPITSQPNSEQNAPLQLPPIEESTIPMEQVIPSE